jgi:hypothetical protein
MNIYKLTFKGGYSKHVIAKSISDAESIWNEKPNRFPIQNIEVIASDVLFKDKF